MDCRRTIGVDPLLSRGLSERLRATGKADAAQGKGFTWVGDESRGRSARSGRGRDTPAGGGGRWVEVVVVVLVVWCVVVSRRWRIVEEQGWASARFVWARVVWEECCVLSINQSINQGGDA